jgi:hypothetical protein
MNVDKFTNMVLNFSFGELEKQADLALDKAIDQMCDDVLKDAKANADAIKDTGKLRDSLVKGFKKGKRGPVAWVKTRGIRYGFAVEYGHGSAKPKPYLGPAMEKHKGKVEEYFKI